MTKCHKRHAAELIQSLGKSIICEKVKCWKIHTAESMVNQGNIEFNNAINVQFFIKCVCTIQNYFLNGVWLFVLYVF